MSQREDEVAYERKARQAKPDPNPVLGLDGKTVFSRTRPMHCPWCGDLFYTYQPADCPFPPYENPMPRIVNGEVKGQRETCGHPRCWDVEQREQVRRCASYQRAATGMGGSRSEKEETRSSARGRLQKVGEAK